MELHGEILFGKEDGNAKLTKEERKNRAEIIKKHFDVEVYKKGKKLVVVGDVPTNNFLDFMSKLTSRISTEASVEYNNVNYLFNKNGEYKIFSF